jgi:hypothetical protein
MLLTTTEIHFLAEAIANSLDIEDLADVDTIEIAITNFLEDETNLE